jgi:hypothetical protein
MDWYRRRKGNAHYPVPGNFKGAKELDKTPGADEVFYLHASMLWTQVAVDGI